MISGASVLMAAVPASAAEVSFATECTPPSASGLPPVDGTTKADITAPATAKVGDEIEVVWKTVQAASKNPDLIDLPANSVKPSGEITVAGAQSGTLAVEGPRENPAIPKNSDMVLSDMKGTLKLTKAGDVTLAPSNYTINAFSTDTTCKPTEAVPVAATIQVTAADGTSSPTPTPTPTPTATATPTPTASSTGSPPSGASFTGKEVQVSYGCKSPIGDKSAVSPVQINAKENSGSYDLTVHFAKSVMDSPADIPAGSIKPSMQVVVGGADTGKVAVEGPTNASAIKSGDPIAIPDLTGTYTPAHDGKATLTPGVLTINALGTTTTCTPTQDPGVSLTLTVAAQSGGITGGTTTSGGGTTTSGTTTSGTTGSLAATGSSDHGALRALAFVAGTTLLLGGAIFTFTPWSKLRR
ncbi:hypothetical protein [Actinacidiphila oryziradicis]|uniref:Uncharacterized protein n=1 Tax=Actinacidiphila oryziradicis TaxID=2571141 RepID=A0A4U0SPL1_9ACTN|nr:hypothetical protein [Actinacidiphila oryziradicis]TKA10121.1 hypothetical protein FCI23_19255 [Actinacidiphila oryziradicis]